MGLPSAGPIRRAVAARRSFRIPAVFAWSLATLPVLAQHAPVPLQRDFNADIERAGALRESRMHTGLKPLIGSRAELDDVLGYRQDSTRHYYWLTEKLLRDHLLEVKGDGFRLIADPLFEFQWGIDEGDPSDYPTNRRYRVNTRGVRVKGDLGGKISFESMFHETQTVLPGYLHRMVQEEGVLMGHGRVKFDGGVVDVGWSRSCVSYVPVRWLNLQVGHGRHFVGHGHRSMLLSDQAPDAPYVKASFLLLQDRVQYTTWHTKLTHRLRTPDDRLAAGDASEAIFYWSRARFNHLSARMGRVELGLFDATIFRNIDENGLVAFDALELNPLVGVAGLVAGFDGPYKTLVGADLKVRLHDQAIVYGQWASDRPGERMAWQAGLRVFDLPVQGMNAQVEYNTADAFMYMSDPVRQAYVHAATPLAHPMGAHFEEVTAMLEHTYRRFRGQARVNLAHYNKDRGFLENHGGDLLKPDVPASAPEGPWAQRLTFLDLNGSYLFNPKTNMRLVAGFMRRDLQGAPDIRQSGYLYIALRTGLYDRYYDL
ncbi:MAG: hypothetical protein KIT10_12960 [Flavobacteriales bacterium]|nr:hypothetical protein [Flavobacteriales bacterium]